MSRNKREGWYGGKMAKGVSVDGKPLKHIRAARFMSLRGTAIKVTTKNKSGEVHNAELLENFPLEVKGLHLLQEFMDERAAKKKEQS
jgi:hypothetical protein